MTTPHHPSPSSSLSRRDFVRLSAGAVAGTMLTGAPSLAAPRRADTLKIGIIGTGGRGTGAAVQALRADKNCILVSMGDVFADRLQSSLKAITEEMGEEGATRVQVPADKQFTGFDCYRGVIDSGVDVVLITGYPAFRPAHYKAAIAAGKHVFAEKPLAVDSAGIRSVLETAAMARQKNLASLVGFCWRYNTGMKAAFEKVHAGAIGDVVSAQTTYHTSTLSKRPRDPKWSDLEFQMRNWWHFTWIGGDHIVEQAIHSVDRLAWAMNDKMPIKVTCLGGRAARSGPEHGDVFDHFAAIYEYDDGRRTFHTCRQIDGCPSDNTDYVFGAKGSALMNGWVPTYEIKNRDNSIAWKGEGKPDDASTMYQNEHDDLFKSIRSGKPINDVERGANSTLMAIMARMAAYTGQTVSWQQAMESKESLVPDKLEFGPFPTPEVAIPGKRKLI
jgi:myo-inositol 2-dehydrogenase / D-chiro-inositol 1-dehydrogenase